MAGPVRPAVQSRLLIINADDYGLTPGVSAAILAAHDRGVVSSTSVLAVAPAFGSTVSGLRDSGLDAGVHLAFVGEDPPLLSAREVPSLVGTDGGFRRSWREFALASALGRIDTDDLHREADAQVERARACGLRPSHLDSHQHVHLLPQVARVVLDLCHDHAIPAVRFPDGDGMGPRHLAVKAMGRHFARRADAAGIAHPDHFVGLADSGHMTTERLTSSIERAAQTAQGPVEIGVHPGNPDDPDRGRYEWGFEWAGELEALCDPQVGLRIREAGWRLGSFRDLIPGG
jgi:predicted glycoside hydrolase/deacetylase ChbG (UPF0249 family)